MSRIPRRPARLAIAATAVAGLVAGGSAGALAAPRDDAAPGTPTLSVTFSHGKMVVTGSRTIPAGQLTVSMTAPKAEKTVALFRLHHGYTFHDFRSDVRKVNNNFGKNGLNHKGLHALRHAIAHITGKGGVDAANGKTHRVVMLTDQKPGTYVLFDDTGQLPAQPRKLTVTAPVGPQHLPSADAKVVAKTNRRFGGDANLPATGDIRFKNISTESPHFLILQHVKDGTTRKEVVQWAQSNSNPTFFRNGSAATDIASNGEAVNIHVNNLPAGTYAEMCFFPDPGEGKGAPHAAMGMVRIVQVK